MLKHVVARLDVDDDLRQRVSGHRELAWRGGFDEQAGTEMEWSRWHGAPPIYCPGLILGGGTASRKVDLANGANVIGEVSNAADDAIELGFAHLTRIPQVLQPA